MEILDRPRASMRLDMSRPVLMTHLAPCACISPMSCCKAAGMGGVSNSAKRVPSKSVEINLIGRDIVGHCVFRIAYLEVFLFTKYANRQHVSLLAQDHDGE